MNEHELRDRITTLEIELRSERRKLELTLAANEELRSEIRAVRLQLLNATEERDRQYDRGRARLEGER